MFELNGATATLEDLQSFAQQNNIDFDTYMDSMRQAGMVEIQPEKDKVKTGIAYGDYGGEISLEEVDYEYDRSKGIRYKSDSYGKILDDIAYGVGNYIKDAAGKAQSGEYTETMLDVVVNPKNITRDQATKVLDVMRLQEQKGVSEDLQKWTKTMEEASNPFYGFFKATIENPKAAGEVIISSAVGQFNALTSSPEVAALAGSAGLVQSNFGGPLVPLRVAAGIRGTMSTLGGVVETTSKIGELIKEEFNGEIPTEDQLLALFKDEERFNKLRNKALAKGLTIAAIDNFGGSMVTSSVAKTAKTGRKVKAATKGLVGETIVGGGGEALSSAVIGEEIKASDVGLEILGQMGQATVDVGAALVIPGSYKVNGEKSSLKEVQRIIETSTPEQLADIKIEVKGNDAFASEVNNKINDAVLETQIDAKVEDPADRKKLVDLEKQRAKAEADTKKKGIFQVPNAKNNLENIEMQINEIIGKYTAVDGRTKDVRARKKVAQDVRTKLDEKKAEATRIAAAKTTATIKKQMKAVDEATGRKGQIIEMNSKDIAESEAETVALYEAEVEGYKQKLNNIKDKKSKEYIDTQNNLNSAQETLSDIKDADTQFGYIIDYSDGSYDVILNKDKPMVGTAAHEFQHKILARTLKNNQDIQNKAGKALTDYVTGKFGGVSPAFINRMSAYINPKTGEQTSAFGEEIITVMSESILDGSLKYNENLFTKVGDIVRQTLQRFGAIDIKFDTGRDVYNFIKDYNRSIEKDYVSKAITKMAVEGAKGKIVEGKKKVKPTTKRKMSKVSPRADQFIKTQINNEMLVDIVNSPSSSKEDVFGAIEALVEKNWPVISKALKFNPTGEISMQSIKEAVTEQMQGIFPKITLPDGKTVNREGKRLLDTYNKEQKVTTFLDATLRPRQAEILTRAKTIDAVSQGVDLEQAKNIAVSTELENETSNQKDTRKRINVLKIPKVARVVKNIRQDTKVVEGDTHKQVTKNNEGHIGNKIFNIPENKITKPSQNLTTSDDIIDVKTGEVITKEELDAGATGILSPSESKNIQDVFSDYETSEQFIKILPKTNVSEKNALINEIGENIPVSRNVYGRAIGLQDRILDYFYEPLFKPNGKRARSQGKTSQVPLWTLKEQFINPKKDVVVQFQRDLGITEQKEINILPTEEQRSVIGQLLKGAARTLSQQVSLSAAQRNLEAAGASPQQIADVTAGQRRRAYSKDKKTKVDGLMDFVISPDFESDIANTNSLLKTFIKKGKYVFDSEASVNEFYNDVENVLIPALPKGYITKRILRPSSRVLGANKNKVIEVNGKKTTIDKYYTKKRNDLLSKKDLVYGKPFTGKAENFTPKKYKDVFGNSAKSFEKANNNGKIKEFNEVNESMHRQLWERVNESIKQNRNNARIWGSYFSTVSLITEHPHRLGAEFVGWSPKPKGFGGKLYEWEHAMPASRAYLYLLESILDPNYNFELAYDLVMDNYKLVALDNYIDKTSIKKAGRTTSMGKGWSIISDSWLDRYFKGDINIDARTIVGLDGRTFEEIYNIPRLKPNLNKNKTLNKATVIARKNSKDPKGITVLDFDDTLATTGSLVKYTAPDGKTGTLNAEQYANTYQDLLDQGYTFDFSDFNKVVKGKLAPLFQKALKLQNKFGPENMFVLTARPPQAQKAIYDFLKANGLNIPLKNITGLANSTSEAKALWIADKVGEGYNDFYFADDALQNVQAVKNMLDQFDVKSKVQQAKVKFSKGISGEFNDILEDVTGIASEKRFSAMKARKRGASKGKFRFFIPPSHEDFVGLLYNFMGKGKQGNAHRDFFEQALIRPLNRAYRELNTARQSIANDYKNLNKQFPDVKKKLTKKTPDGDFTYQDAIRVYLWDKHGYEVPGLSETDQKELVDLIKSDGKLQAYADVINVISKRDDYVSPIETWEAGDLRTDLDDATGRIGREQFFTEFFENADIIFSPENMNKIEAAYGAEMVDALKDMLYRTKTGRNRPSGQNKQVNQFMNWLNGSVAATMFFNIRSAVLQQMSLVNFINFADNNVLAAAKAFANQKQYWADWAMLFNSDFMKQRRGGIMTDVNGAELAASVRDAKNPAQAVIKKLLEIGFLPTQIGDNIAIATGGAPFYRNRVNSYLKEGLSQKEAEQKAFVDFQVLAEATQQSARPDMVSQQQASPLGKVILAFQNVTSQFNRLGKKAFLDIKNRRITPGNKTQAQSDISNMSRIAYYFAIQNLIFYSLQSALFMAMFDDDEDDEKYLKKKERMINGSIDSVLRGSGVWGAVVSTLKNMAIKRLDKKDQKRSSNIYDVLAEGLQVSPPLGIKARKLIQAEKDLVWKKKIIEEMDTFDIENPMWSAYTSYIEGLANIPLNRLYNKTLNVRESLNNQNSAMDRILMFSGWSKWNLGIEDVSKSKGKQKFGIKKREIKQRAIKKR